MTAIEFDTPSVLRVLTSGDVCRAYTGAANGAHLAVCKGKPQLVTLACEHEHFFDALICDDHQRTVRDMPRPCPLCYGSERAPHRCRIDVVGEVTR